MPHAKYKLCYVAWRGLMRVCVSPPLSSVLVSVLIIICAHQNVVNQHTDLAEYRTWVKCTYKVRGDDRAVVPIFSERMTASTFRLPISM